MKISTKICCFFFIVIYCSLNCNSQCLTSSDEQIDGQISTDLFHASKFGIKLFKTFIAEDPQKNIFFSPYSIWNALALAYLGSEDITEHELKDTLGITHKVSTIKTWRGLNYIYKIRQLSTTGYFFGLANAIFLNESLNIRPCINSMLGNDLQTVNFQDKIQTSAIINDFVRISTDGRIPTVVESSELENAEAVIINAAFFADKWRKPFKKQNTKTSNFYPLNGQPKKIQMMTNKGYFNHGVSEILRSHILELPYSLSDISMFVFLAPSIDMEKGFDYLLENLNSESFLEAIQGLSVDELDIALPKLTITQTFTEDLKKALDQSGIHQLFDPRGANLNTFVPDSKVVVSSLVHQASLVLSEEGTQASAQSPSAIYSARFARPQHLKSFICDHPFIYTIYDKLTRNILFIGAFRG